MYVEIKEFLMCSQETQRWQQHQFHPSFPTVASSLPPQLLCHPKQESMTMLVRRTLQGNNPYPQHRRSNNYTKWEGIKPEPLKIQFTWYWPPLSFYCGNPDHLEVDQLPPKLQVWHGPEITGKKSRETPKIKISCQALHLLHLPQLAAQEALLLKP